MKQDRKFVPIPRGLHQMSDEEIYQLAERMYDSITQGLMGEDDTDSASDEGDYVSSE